MPFAHEWWDFRNRMENWEDDFISLLIKPQDYARLGTDDYDASIEIYEATDDWRLSEAQQRFLSEAGFAKVYVNHKDGWQTHYTFGSDAVLPTRGWRRRYVADAEATTTNVIAGEPNPGYYEISYWPESWTGPQTAEWQSSGYMRIVPDPLDPFATPAHQGDAA